MRVRRPIAWVLTVAVLSGCASSSNPPADDTGSASPSATDSPAATTSPAVIDVTPLAPHEIQIDIEFSSPGIASGGGGTDPPSCPGTPPDGCTVGIHEVIIPADATVFNGTFMDYAYAYPDSVEQQTFAGNWLFAGSIVGCMGSGTARFPWFGEIDQGSPVSPNPNGEVVHAHDYVLTPTELTGTLNVTAANLDAEYDISPVTFSVSNGRMTGTLSCW